ncbi:hypothetical protein RB653_003758 [Dictyostelium firmibasis]|uniref:WD40 repeat-like protein n=1 Tax=Dictyostelium firmibasis TaxID=79012 RepID=A0AAN7U533_9MYCE
MLGPDFQKYSNQSNYHFDSFPYENSYEEEEYQDKYKEIVFRDKWGPQYAIQQQTSAPNKRNVSKKIGSPLSSPTFKSSSSHLSSSSNSNHHKKRESSIKFKDIIKNLLLPNKFNPLKKTTFISILPIEITMKIISYLPFQDVLSIQFVCSEWYLITREEILWKTVYQNYFQVYPNRELVLKKSEKSSQLNWRDIFKQQHDRESRWKGDRFKEAHLIGHTGTVWALHLDDERVYTGSFDKSAKVWDTKTKKCRFTLAGHYYPIQCLDVKNNIMATGSLDNSIRIWDLEKGQSKGILTTRAHNFDVFCLQQIGDQIISGSSDSTVKVWNIADIINDTTEIPDSEEGDDALQDNVINDPFAVNNSFTSLPDINEPDHVHTNIVSVNDKTSTRYRNHNLSSTHTFKHQSCVTCLQVYGNILMSGGSDRVVRVWDLNTSQPIQILSGHNEGVRALQFNGNVLVTGSDDTTVRVWDLRSKNCNISTLRGHNGSVRCLQWDGTTLITGSNDQSVRWWNLNYDSDQSKELFSFNSSISCLKFTDNILMCGLSDSKVQINKFY